MDGKNTNPSIEFIDPISMIIKLGILSLKEIGTKISIKNNLVQLDLPSIFQGLYRWYYADQRSHIFHLRLPILYWKGISMGFITTGIGSDLLSFELINSFAIDGLGKLKETYKQTQKENIICNTIDEYIKVLNHKYTQEEFMVEMKSSQRPSLFVIFDDQIKKWDTNEIRFISGLFKYSQSKSQTNRKILAEIGDSILHFANVKDCESFF